MIVLITTYNRPDKLLSLLSDIDREGGAEVYVYDDGSTEDYEPILYKSKKVKVHYFKFKKNHGKQEYWKVINKVFDDVRRIEGDYFYMLPDDVRLVEGFFEKSKQLWKTLDNPICLSTLMDEGRRGVKNWTNITPQDLGDVIRTQWNDLCFMCEKTFFEALDYRINDINSSRFTDPNISSGVGQQVSQRLYRSWNMYHVKQSLVIHSNGTSVMHPNTRIKEPLIAGTDKITAGVAVIPNRERAFLDVVRAVLPQVNQLNVYLNGFRDTPRFLNIDKVKIFTSQQTGDKGDAGKYFEVENTEGYYISIDDDILYPRDYVSTLIRKIEFYKREAIVSFHGCTLVEPINNYYKDKKLHHCLRELKKDQVVHIGGTGVMGFHTDTLKVKWDDFKHPNMADIWIGKLAQEQKIPMIAASHPNGWIKLNRRVRQQDTIYWKESNRAHYQTQVCNELKWNLNLPHATS